MVPCIFSSININHVVAELNCKFCLFADDFRLFLATAISKSNYSVSHSILQRDINTLYSTSSSWGLSFLVGKCARMNFCRNFLDAPVPLPHFMRNQTIQDVDNHKDLGVRVDSSLKVSLACKGNYWLGWRHWFQYFQGYPLQI